MPESMPWDDCRSGLFRLPGFGGYAWSMRTTVFPVADGETESGQSTLGFDIGLLSPFSDITYLCRDAGPGLVEALADFFLAFPDVEHECEHDVFRDVFAYWTTHGLSLAESVSEQRDDVNASEEESDETGNVTAPLRRVTLETSYAFMSSDYEVIATWIDDDILHVATCDYGDRTDRMAWGEDIPEAFALFAWMIADRFGADRERLFEYADQHGSPCVLESTQDQSDGTPHGLSFALDEGAALAHHRTFGDPWECRFGDWRGLLLHLLVDRCEGVGARDRVTAVLQSAGVTSVERDRGYV